MLAYLLGLVDRGRLKEINYRLLIGDAIAPERARAGDRGLRRPAGRAPTSCPARCASIAADKAAGRRLVMATASYRLYAAAIAQRLGFDDVIATETQIDAHGPDHRPDRRAATATASPSWP